MGAGQSIPPEVAEKCQLNSADVKKILKAFKKGADKKKQLDKLGFIKVFYSLGLEIRSKNAFFEDYEQLFDLLDTDHSGTLDLEELLIGISIMATGTLEDKATLTFKAMDVDNSKSLDHEEVKAQFLKLYNVFAASMKSKMAVTIYQKTGQFVPDRTLNVLLDAGLAPLKKMLTEDGVKFVFSKGDKNNDDKLTLDEWLEVVKENELAQWLVCPDQYIKKVEAEIAPKLAALMTQQ